MNEQNLSPHAPPRPSSSRSTFQFVSLVVLLTSIVLSWLILWHALRGAKNQDADLGDYLFLLGVWAWVASPYAGLLVLRYWAEVRPAGPLVILVGALLVAAFGLFIYFDAFLVNLDAQNGLVFVSVPFLQWVGCLAVGLACWTIGATVQVRGR